jgi:hypothetical protein
MFLKSAVLQEMFYKIFEVLMSFIFDIFYISVFICIYDVFVWSLKHRHVLNELKKIVKQQERLKDDQNTQLKWCRDMADIIEEKYQTSETDANNGQKGTTVDVGTDNPVSDLTKFMSKSSDSDSKFTFGEEYRILSVDRETKRASAIYISKELYEFLLGLNRHNEILTNETIDEYLEYCFTDYSNDEIINNKNIQKDETLIKLLGIGRGVKTYKEVLNNLSLYLEPHFLQL